MAQSSFSPIPTWGALLVAGATMLGSWTYTYFNSERHTAVDIATLKAEMDDHTNRLNRIEATENGLDTKVDQLIQGLLTYSRLTHIEVETENVEVAEVLDSVLQNLREDIRLSHADVQVTGSLPTLRANRIMLIQIVTNLISNAVKFGGDCPAVAVVLERDGDLARITVEDHGIGIAPQHQERIFRAFERLHGVESYPGTGMGLAIVRKAIERMGGQVGLRSQEGKGSRFWIELPRSLVAA